MNPRFSEATKNLDSLYKQLLAMPPVTAGSLPKTMPKNGIYLFSENGQHLAYRVLLTEWQRSHSASPARLLDF
jgi:hypothetical protein